MAPVEPPLPSPPASPPRRRDRLAVRSVKYQHIEPACLLLGKVPHQRIPECLGGADRAEPRRYGRDGLMGPNHSTRYIALPDVPSDRAYGRSWSVGAVQSSAFQCLLTSIGRAAAPLAKDYHVDAPVVAAARLGHHGRPDRDAERQQPVG